MAFDVDIKLNTSFNKDAEKYHTFRPSYPEELFEALATSTHLTPGGRLLEIGPGTGQATKPLAKKGYQITAIELGDSLATKARRVLQAYPNVNVITGAFEAVPVPDAHFDLVFSATAFHWIHPEQKFQKPFRILKPGGYLAIIHTELLSDECGDEFFQAIKPICQEYGYNSPSAKDDFQLPRINDLQPPRIDDSLFNLENFTAFRKVTAYSGADYAGLLSTYSPAIALPKDRRSEFLESIRQLVDTKFNGTITRHVAMTLATAKVNPILPTVGAPYLDAD